MLAHVRATALDAARPQAVIASIHQPAAALWGMFDSVTLLSAGRLLYNGPAGGLAPWLVGALGRR